MLFFFFVLPICIVKNPLKTKFVVEMFPNAFVKNRHSPRRNHQKLHIFFTLTSAGLLHRKWKTAGRHLLSTIRIAIVKICRERHNVYTKSRLLSTLYVMRVRDISLQPSSGFSSEHRGSSAKLLLRPFVKVSKSTRIYGFRSRGFIYQGADGKCVIDNNGWCLSALKTLNHVSILKFHLHAQLHKTTFKS